MSSTYDRKQQRAHHHHLLLPRETVTFPPSPLLGKLNGCRISTCCKFNDWGGGACKGKTSALETVHLKGVSECFFVEEKTLFLALSQMD